MKQGGVLKYTRNLHIIGRTLRTQPQNNEAELVTHNLEACILEVIAHPEDGGWRYELHVVSLYVLKPPPPPI